ncbi:tRNA pseudouridine(55) synthase TruB [Candidatus Saccharibacteria bacterium]|nr:tRNA pseudouridine(55) synthase TruB [Candidatus Saccharibacteria bacterium]
MDGLLLIDKPKGWTSFDVVAKVRGILQKAENEKVARLLHVDAAQGSQEERANRISDTESERKTLADTAMHHKHAGVAGSAGQQGSAVRKIRVGHAGTLDPQATGLLTILVGSYCKRAQEFSKLDKVYEVEMELGKTSTTDDSEGAITETKQQIPDKTTVEQAILSFVGEIDQTPPAFSAIKVNGKRAYKLARAGKTVELEPRKVTIYAIDDIKITGDRVTFTVEVSSGTYIRSLVRDIGQKLGCGAYMTELRRTKVGNFDLKNAVGIREINHLNFDKIKDIL